MALKIATVDTVFAACDRLDAANTRWNREDVRNEVGGGGYVVIDPLIKAWRGLKPLREAAPTTPAELLHQVATTLESHITSFIGEAESRLAETQQVFDTTVLELSERLASQESELEEKETALQAMAADRSKLAEQLEESQESLSEIKVAHTQLVTENDGCRGQIARMEREHKEALAKLDADAKAVAKAQTRERAKASEEHSAELAGQRKEMTEAGEQTENRLMVILDQERQAAKESTAQLSDQLAKVSEKAQSHREKAIELEATIRELKGQNGKLDSDLAETTVQCSEFSTALKAEKTITSSIQSEFEAYKKEYMISGNLGALQTAVAAMQAKLEERQDALAPMISTVVWLWRRLAVIPPCQN
jgi:chromosome segregation ATPase